MSSSHFTSKILILFLGAFFIVLGITGVFRDLGESIFSITSEYSTMEIIFGVIEIICGLLLFIGFFLFYDSRPVFWGGFILMVMWIIRIAMTRFMWGMNFIYNGTISIPKLISWLLILLCELIILAALIVILRK